MPTTADMRYFLTSAFSDEEITTLCFDQFRPVYDNFSTGMSKGQKIQRLLEFCEQHAEWPNLLTALQHERPAQFARFLEASGATDQPGQPPRPPEVTHPPSPAGTNISGGINLNARDVSIGGDAVGRDKVVTINGNVYIIHTGSTRGGVDSG